ncbi:MAG: type I methionyl aminopeptidase [bacterium]|nr:type I methionyl aminopeptidase [bacterium]
MIPIKTAGEIEALRRSAALLVRTFRAVERAIRPGTATGELDAIAEQTIRQGGGSPAFKGYNGYPATVCVSIDEQVVHGIPGSRVIREGEIVSLDIGVNLEGFFSDAAKSYAIGEVSPEKKRLIEATRAALTDGIRECRPANRLSDISHAIQRSAERAGFSVVRELVGHGIGRAMHEEPQVPNFGAAHRGPRLQAGMVFAIEPMINIGSEKVRILEDGWTVVTEDGAPSAHFEHTVLITQDRPEILTAGMDGTFQEH